MEKDFDRWDEYKKKIDAINRDEIHIAERDVWWCSIGVNVGREQQSQTGDFSRPVLVVKRFTSDLFLGVPLTTKVRDTKFRVRIKTGNGTNDALIFHMRTFDTKRLVRKAYVLPNDDFTKIIQMIIAAMLSVTTKNEIPP